MELVIPWWAWVLILFVMSFVIGVLAVVGGLGGGTLYVSIIGSFSPFHLDFVRGASLLIALANALVASPGLLKNGLADLRLALPLGVVSSSFSIIGALIGLRLPTEIVQFSLGAILIGIAAIMIATERVGDPEVTQADTLAIALGLNGSYYEASSAKSIDWRIHVRFGMLAFALIGFVGGMFGIGAGWANVPALNLLMARRSKFLSPRAILSFQFRIRQLRGST
jgi:uncharacterized membrane protein YfcA